MDASYPRYRYQSPRIIQRILFRASRSVNTASVFLPVLKPSKKHLRRSCPVLHEGTLPPRETAEATGPGVLGASDREGSLGHSCRIPQAAAAESPLEHASQATESLISNHSFLQALRSGWRLAAATADFQQVLRKHCAYCHQWVSLKSPGIKQHCRLMHPEYWQHKASANSLCSSAGLSSATPCTYCGVQYKDPRAHVKHCPVLFQFALAYTTHGQAPRFGGGDGGEPGLGRSAGDAPGLGRPLPTEGGGTAREATEPKPTSRSQRNGPNRNPNVPGERAKGGTTSGSPSPPRTRPSWTSRRSTCCAP